jgi:N-terminal domain of NWD NACHT-NTPase
VLSCNLRGAWRLGALVALFSRTPASYATIPQPAVNTGLPGNMPLLSRLYNALRRKRNGKGEKNSPDQPSLPQPDRVVDETASKADVLASNADEATFHGPEETSATTNEVADSFSPTKTVNPWTQAFEVLWLREPDLMADYRTYVASLQGNTSGQGLSTSEIQSVVNRLLEDREESRWLVSFFGKPVKIREQAEKLTKFLLWTDPLVKNAISAQPYAALAWSGVSMLLPVG